MGFAWCPTASPTPTVCVCGVLWRCTGALSKNVLYATYICYLILFFLFELWLAKFSWSQGLLFATWDWGVFKLFSSWDVFKTSKKYYTKSSQEFSENVFAETFVLYMSISHCSILRWNHLNIQYNYFYSSPLLC